MVLTSGLCVGKEWGVGGSFLRDLHDSDDVVVRGEGGPVRRRNVLDLHRNIIIIQAFSFVSCRVA